MGEALPVMAGFSTRNGLMTKLDLLLVVEMVILSDFIANELCFVGLYGGKSLNMITFLGWLNTKHVSLCGSIGNPTLSPTMTCANMSSIGKGLNLARVNCWVQ